ncbi:MAG: hypothetical protein WAM04_23255 [Candidatus Sulfotelmatobacter sp.]
MQPSNSDLDVALAFVVERISQQAERSAAPLKDDEEHFLNHLPTEPRNSTAVEASGFNTAYEEFLPTPILRDLQFEKLCKLASDAHSHDLQTRPEAAHKWEFAVAVLQLHHHPMSWLLGWAGIRTRKRRQLRDLLLLVATAIFVVVLSLAGAFALSALTDGLNYVWKWTLWVAGGCVYGAIMTLLYFAVRRHEARQQDQEVERYRRQIPVRGSAHSPR